VAGKTGHSREISTIKGLLYADNCNVILIGCVPDPALFNLQYSYMNGVSRENGDMSLPWDIYRLILDVTEKQFDKGYQFENRIIPQISGKKQEKG